jgi:hypothetical protein
MALQGGQARRAARSSKPKHQKRALTARKQRFLTAVHNYAQTRYAELTGWKAPAAGGPTSKQLSADQKVIDRQARLTISRELGHEREQITAVYLGR